MDPESIGYSIGQCEFIRTIHNSFAKPEPIIIKNDSKNAKKEDAFHFVSFIHYKDKLFEIDGLKRGPILHRTDVKDYESFLQNCVEVIGEKIQLYSQKEIRFHLLAVRKSNIKQCQE